MCCLNSHFIADEYACERFPGHIKDHHTPALRDWSLIMGRGGYKMGGGLHVKFYPYGNEGRKQF